ncbi:MAG: mechanosensitive ion channel domain-containing protein [Cyanobacteria bacterium P01_A01_bin.123]
MGFALAIALFGSMPLPGFAQVTPETASVVLDGRTLFAVAETDGLTANERADDINSLINAAVDAETPPKLDLKSVGKTPVIELDGVQLVSITLQDLKASSDVALDNPDLNLRSLANAWLVKLRQAITRARQERRPEFLRRAIIIAVVVLACAIALHSFLNLLWRRYFRRLLRRLTLSDPASDEAMPTEFKLLLAGSLLIARLVLWGSAVFYVVNLFPLTRQWGYVIGNALLNTFVASNFSLGDRSFSVLDLLVLVALIIALILLTSTITNLLRSRFLTIAGINRGAQEAVAVMIRYSLISIGTVVILQIWGLDLSSLALLASALSVGIGLGLQNIARDFGSGLVLIFERPIQVGEFVEFGEFMGTVERIGPRSTEIRTLDQVSIIVPNSRFLDQEVINWSHRNPISRIRIPVGVAYGSDPDQVRKVLLEAGRKHAKVLSTPSPLVLFSGFGDSSLDFQLLVWIAEPGKQLIIRSDLYFMIEARLSEHDIEIPFPQRDLHVRSGTLPVELPSELKTMLIQWAKQNQNGQSS